MEFASILVGQFALVGRAERAPAHNVGDRWFTGAMGRNPDVARRLFDRFEPVHVVTYFATESREALRRAGFDDFWMGYFAARSAPLGPVPPEVVTAVFFNFSDGRVGEALPAAWLIANPAEVLSIRQTAATAALQRYGLRADDENVAEATRLLSKAARQAPVDARPLFAANAAMPWPQDPLAALWHSSTLLREHRGDGHVIALAAAGISGRESNVLHAAASLISRDTISQLRDYGDREWRDIEQRLGRRGLLGMDGSLTEHGREVKASIELTTDRLAMSALDGLSNDEIEQLFQALTPVTRQVIAGGDVPEESPQSMRRDGLDDASAQLG